MKINSYKIDSSLVGKCIVSTPAMPDNRFYKAVVFITSHNANGSMGIVINKPSAHQFIHIVKSVMNDFDEKTLIMADQKVSIVLGGPANPNNLFILHSNDYKMKDTSVVTDKLNMTNQPSIITDLAKATGPKQSIISIGCSTWVAGQLEKELATDSWVIADMSLEQVFNIQANKLHDELSHVIGINTNNSAFFASSDKIN